MTSLRRYLQNTNLCNLAIPSNMQYGTAICARGGITVIIESDTSVEAWAGGLDGSNIEGGGSRRRVQLWLEGANLRWHCSGNPKDHDIFCKHCVAIALYLAQ